MMISNWLKTHTFPWFLQTISALLKYLGLKTRFITWSNFTKTPDANLLYLEISYCDEPKLIQR